MTSEDRMIRDQLEMIHDRLELIEARLAKIEENLDTIKRRLQIEDVEIEQSHTHEVPGGS